MKKRTAVLAALLLVLALLLPAAAEEQASPEDYPESLAFENLWVDGESGAEAEIVRRVDFFDVRIRARDPEGAESVWEYITTWQPETKTLKSDGEGQKLPGSGGEEYEEGLSAEFEISGDGVLAWHDLRDGAGDGLAFLPVGLFGGLWSCGEETVVITRKEGTAYSVQVRTADGAEEPAFDAVYDPAAGVLEGAGGRFTIGEGFLMQWKAPDGSRDGMEYMKEWDD